MRNFLTIGVAVIAGAASGLGAPLLLGERAPRPPAPAPVAAARAAEPPLGADPRVASLERRMAGVQQRLQAQETKEGAPKAGELPEARAEKERMAEAAHEAALALHRQEPRDAPWAREREQALTGQLTQAAPTVGMEVVGVDCRTTSCVARLRWADMATARGQIAALLDETARVGCARRIQFPDTGAAPYEAELYLECPRSP